MVTTTGWRDTNAETNTHAAFRLTLYASIGIAVAVIAAAAVSVTALVAVASAVLLTLQVSVYYGWRHPSRQPLVRRADVADSLIWVVFPVQLAALSAHFLDVAPPRSATVAGAGFLVVLGAQMASASVSRKASRTVRAEAYTLGETAYEMVEAVVPPFQPNSGNWSQSWAQHEKAITKAFEAAAREREALTVAWMDVPMALRRRVAMMRARVAPEDAFRPDIAQMDVDDLETLVAFERFAREGLPDDPGS